MYQYIPPCVKGYTGGGSCVATSQLNTHRGRERRWGQALDGNVSVLEKVVSLGIVS